MIISATRKISVISHWANHNSKTFVAMRSSDRTLADESGIMIILHQDNRELHHANIHEQKREIMFGLSKSLKRSLGSF